MRTGSPSALATELIADIDAELAEEPTQKSRLDGDALVSRKHEMLGLVDGAKAAVKGPDAVKAIEAHAASLEHGFGVLDAALAKLPLAVTGARRYSNAAREACARVFEQLSGIRRKLGRRLGSSALARGIRTDVGVGAIFNADSPTEIHAWGVKQVATLEKPENQPLFKQRGVRAKLLVDELKPLVVTLKKEIDAGPGTTLRQGAVSAEINAALCWLEVALDRTVSTLTDFHAREAAAALDDLVPGRPQRRASDRGDEPTPAEPPATPVLDGVNAPPAQA